MTRPATPAEIARALGGGKEQKTTGGWKTICPGHEDTNPSLIIYEKGVKDGKPWVQCPVCGTNERLYKAIEERTGMHFADRKSETRKKIRAVYPASIPWQPVRLKGVSPSKHWEYTDEQGVLLFVVARYDFHDGKTIRPYSVGDRNGQAAWLPALQLSPIPMYNTQELADKPDATVLVVEGEKAADAAKLMPEFSDIVVTTYQGGGKNWKKADKRHLKGRKILLWPDNDDVGKNSFRDFARWLNTEDFAEEVLIASIPKSFPQKWDLADEWPDGAGYDSVSWKKGPRPDRQFQLGTIDPTNFMEAFDSLYWLYHDMKNIYTISKEYADFRQGAAIRPTEHNARMTINTNHEAWDCCIVDRKQAIRVWAAEKLRNNDYVTGFGFFPEETDDVVIRLGMKQFNGFTGWVHKPEPHGSCDLFKDYILDVLCASDKRAFDYIWNYLSHMIQAPHVKPSVALLFKGSKGTGKSFFFQIIYNLLGGVSGYGYMCNSSNTFNGSFNGHYASCNLALFVHEWEITKSRSIENVVKSLITDDLLDVNIKFQPNFQTNNYTRVMGATNHNHVWNTSQDERRISIFEVSDEHRQDHAYFKAIIEEMQDGGYSRLMYELNQAEVQDYMVRTPYTNKALAKQKELSKTPAQALAYDMLRRGEIRLQTFDERRDIQESYHVEHNAWMARQCGLPSTLIRDVIDRLFVRRSSEVYEADNKDASLPGVLLWMGVEQKVRTSVTINSFGHNKAVAGYKIPPLEEARKAYSEKAGIPYEELFDHDIDVIDFPQPEQKSMDDAPF